MANQWKLQGRKTYATQEGAIKAAEKLIAKMTPSLDSIDVYCPKYLMGVAEDGRFTPVFFSTRHAAIWFAQQGFSVVG